MSFTALPPGPAAGESDEFALSVASADLDADTVLWNGALSAAGSFHSDVRLVEGPGGTTGCEDAPSPSVPGAAQPTAVVAALALLALGALELRRRRAGTAPRS